MLSHLAYRGHSLARVERCAGVVDCCCGLKYSRCRGLRWLGLAIEHERAGNVEGARYAMKRALECAI